jgi:hypothetical protein
MIHKSIILYDEKLIHNKFSIIKKDNKIIINSLNIKEDIIKVPIYNKYNGIDYISICFPLEYFIIDNYIFNPYLILSSYNLKINNDLDFFINLNQAIYNEYQLNILKFDDLLNNPKINFIKIMNDNYNFNNLNESETLIKNLWFNINLIKLYIIYLFIKYPNGLNKNLNVPVPKYILNIYNDIKKFKYTLSNNDTEYKMTFNEYITHNFTNSLKLSEIKKDNNYFIIIGGCSELVSTESTCLLQTKIVKINVKKVIKNIITINDKNLIFEKYRWYYFYPNINITFDFIIYQTFNNNNFTSQIIKNIIGFEDNHIIKYFTTDNKLNNLIVLVNIFPQLEKYMNDINILKNNSYDSEYFQYITKKYSNDEDKLFEIIGILFDNYTFPFKYNRYNIEPIFDYIMYISMYNYQKILTSNKNIIIKFNEILNPKINNIIPFKLKNLYINFLKIIQNLVCKEYDLVIFNQKFYNDSLHKHIIKLLLSDTNCLTARLFKEMIPIAVYNRFREIIKNNILLIDISNKLSWKTLPKKLYYIKFFYNNSDIIFYQQKLNKNIIPDNFDVKIKRIIENPFEMYKFVKKEKDFIKWTNFISDKLNDLYHIPISLSSEDFDNIGKLLYLLFNINEQNLNNNSYKEFIKFCNQHHKIILDSTRINLKIKEYFQNINLNINLGFLAKHLTSENEILTFENPINEVLLLKQELSIINKKYYKYKIKYLQTKSSSLELDIHNSDIVFSETSKIN